MHTARKFLTMTDPRFAALAAGDKFMALLQKCDEDHVRLEIHELTKILNGIRADMREEADEGRAA